MNSLIEKYARETILNKLQQCSKDEQEMFKRMYAHGKEISIEECVKIMDTDKLDWAMQQIERTLQKRKNK
jgi:hypothetical protein